MWKVWEVREVREESLAPLSSLSPRKRASKTLQKHAILLRLIKQSIAAEFSFT